MARWAMWACVVAMPCAAAAEVPAVGEGPNPALVLRALARPAPSATDFVEIRGSALLKQPLQISGQYRRPDRDTLVREVRSPYRETTTIAQGQAVVAREGKAEQRYPLDRVPELAGIQSSFGALLEGDAQALQRQYRVQSQGTLQQWQLQLQPRDPALLKRVRAIRLYGDGGELRCIVTVPARGDVQRTLLGTAAHAVEQGASAQVQCEQGSR